ncbi:hypothetical protein ACFLZ4_01480 [Patescibacteria group bacterium]
MGRLGSIVLVTTGMTGVFPEPNSTHKPLTFVRSKGRRSRNRLTKRSIVEQVHHGRALNISDYVNLPERTPIRKGSVVDVSIEQSRIFSKCCWIKIRLSSFFDKRQCWNNLEKVSFGWIPLHRTTPTKDYERLVENFPNLPPKKNWPIIKIL